MIQIYEDHTKGIHYTLSLEAEKNFDGLTDSYSDFINSKYGSDNEEDKENNQHNDSQTETYQPTITSKDTTHVLRLSTVLHILNHYLTCALNGENLPVPTEITDVNMKQAMVLYNVLAQQKALFVQAIDSLEKQVACVRVRPGLSFRERVLKTICKAKGPFAPLRYIQHHLKGSLSHNIKIELEMLEKKGFGLFKTIRARTGTRDIFWKMHPNCIDGEIGEHSNMLKSIGISIENYASSFNDMSNITEEMRAFLIQNHPQAEMSNEFVVTLPK